MLISVTKKNSETFGKIRIEIIFRIVNIELIRECKIMGEVSQLELSISLIRSYFIFYQNHISYTKEIKCRQVNLFEAQKSIGRD